MRLPKMLLAVAVACVSFGAITQSASAAALLAYEGFDSGWFPAANGGNMGVALSSSLSYGGLVTSGGARQGGESPYLKANLPMVNSGTVWMSWLFKSDKNAWNRVITYNGVDSYGASERSNLGLMGDGFAVRDVPGGNRFSDWPNTTVTSATTYMLVAKYDFGTAANNDGSITMWINPDVSSLGTGTAPTGGQQRSLGFTDEAADMAFNGIAFHGVDGGAVTVYDELRVGTSWAAVSPVPEPATLGIVAVAMAGLTIRRRQA